MTMLEEIRAKVREAIGIPVGALIYGRPIMLHDVLRAMGVIATIPPQFHIDVDGNMREMVRTEKGLGSVVMCTWDLALPLDNQPAKVLSFLHKLICA